MTRSTNELVQNLQSNKKSSSNNVVKLSEVYDEATNSVAKIKRKSQQFKSNTSSICEQTNGISRK